MSDTGEGEGEYTIVLDGVTRKIKSLRLNISSVELTPKITKAIITNPVRSVDQGEKVELDYSQSHASEGAELISYSWKQVSGISTGLQIDEANRKCSFVTPMGATTDIVLLFSLTVVDNKSISDTTEARITVKLPRTTQPPLPSSGKDSKDKSKASKDPATWKVVNMRDQPQLFKVVDNKPMNVAIEFLTRADAQQYIDHYLWEKNVPPPPPPPPPQTCDEGYHWDAAQGKCIKNEEPGPGPGPGPGPITEKVDAEGIQKIYKDDPSKADTQFYLHKDGNNSPRLSGKGDRKVLSDGSIDITPTQGTSPASARIYIRTPDGTFDYNEQVKKGWDWNANLARNDKDGVNRGGWMYTVNDYREVEGTHYYKIPKINKDDEMTDYVGGGHPSDDQYPLQCISSCYKAQLRTENCDGRGAIEWDHWSSPDNYAWNEKISGKFDLKAALGGTMQNKVIGQKYVRYNEVGSDGKLKAVHQEIWVDLESKDLPKPDLSKQKWQFYIEYVHDGTNWPTQPKFNGFIKGCNGQNVPMPAWGAPVFAMRFDESNWTLFYLSVRPILTEKIGIGEGGGSQALAATTEKKEEPKAIKMAKGKKGGNKK